ncbi:MAG TPA: hypothetical protein DIC60_03735 [Lachnospiraceae bacterium]|nr:hypothetical protein [Lachnospiraceae bacterium]
MSLFIDPKKEPTVYTNIFGKIRRDFYNARNAAKMDGKFRGKLSLKQKKSSLDSFDGYVYKYPGAFGCEVSIYDDNVNANVTPGRVAEAAEKVITRLGKDFIKRVYIAKESYSKDPEIDAVVTKDIVILNSNRSLSANQLDEILYLHGLCSLCDYAIRQNKEQDSPLYYDTSTENTLWKLFEEQQKGVSSIGKKEGWYFGHITEEIFEDKPFEWALMSAEKIIKEIKKCASGEDFTFAKIATLYFKDQENFKRNYYDYFLVMKRMIKLYPMSEKSRIVAKRGELDRIIFNDVESKREVMVDGH